MKLYFVRHGETDVNSGLTRADTAQLNEPLNTVGIMQAEQLAEQIRDLTFDTVVSSQSRRALQTATIINEFHNLDIQIDDAWRELTTSHYLDATSWHEAFDFNQTKVIAGVEPIQDFFGRIYTALDTLKASYGKDETVLVVSHGGAHQAVRAYVDNLPLVGNMRLDPMKNCEVRVYEL